LQGTPKERELEDRREDYVIDEERNEDDLEDRMSGYV
jgi:hypothetical protein